MADIHALLDFMPMLNVLIVPALAFVYRIDKRMGQMDVLELEKERRILALECDMKKLVESVYRIEYSTRHS